MNPVRLSHRFDGEGRSDGLPLHSGNALGV